MTTSATAAGGNPPDLFSAQVGRLQAVLRSLQKFDNIEVLPVVKGLLTPTDRDHCFIAGYYRVLAGVRTLVVFNDPSQFQAIAMLARAVFEIAVDLRLIDVIPDAVPKLYAYSAIERLRAARDAVAFVDAGKSTHDVTHQRSFISSQGPTIDAQRLALWPNAKRVSHWSSMSLRDRAKKLGAPYDEGYELNYAQLSWDVHPGLAGVLNLDAAAFPAKCGVAFHFAIDWYSDVVRTVAKEFRIDQAVPQFGQKLRLARLLPMTDSHDEAVKLRHALLG